MNNDKPKKTKKQAKKQEAAVSELAAEILNNVDSESTIEDLPELIESPSTIEQKYEKLPTEETEIKETPKPINFDKGLTKETAFIIQSNLHEMYQTLSQYFGCEDGAYFIVNENTASYIKDRIRRRYKTLFVEDKNGFKYILWFNLSKLGYIY